MSSMFDSAVYSLRKAAPFTTPDIINFLANKAYAADGAVILEVHYRKSVSSRLWWSITWHEDRQAYGVSAQEWDLCVWRAIQLHKDNERRREIENGPVSKGRSLTGLSSVSCIGWQDGDGI